MATSASVIATVTSTIISNGFRIKIENFTSGKRISTHGVWTEDVSEDSSSGDNLDILVTKKTQKIMIPYITIKPEVGDYVIVGSDTYSIDIVEAYNMGLDAVAYELEVSS